MNKGLNGRSNKKGKPLTIRLEHFLEDFVKEQIETGTKLGKHYINQTFVIEEGLRKLKELGGLHNGLTHCGKETISLLDQINVNVEREAEKLQTQYKGLITELKNGTFVITPETRLKTKELITRLDELGKNSPEIKEQLIKLQKTFQDFINKTQNKTLALFEILEKNKEKELEEEELRKKEFVERQKELVTPKNKKQIQPKLPKRSREEELVILRRSYEKMSLTDLEKGTKESTFKNLLKDERELVLDILEGRSYTEVKSSRAKTPAEGQT